MATLVTYLIKRSWREKADGSSTRSLLTSFHVARIIYTDIRPATGSELSPKPPEETAFEPLRRCWAIQEAEKASTFVDGVKPSRAS